MPLDFLSLTINGLLNGSPFVPGTLYEDTNHEIWCTYAPQPLFRCCSGIPTSPGCASPGCGTFPGFAAVGFSIGTPFTEFYKDCLQQTTNQALRIINEFIVTAFNEYPGWMARFWLAYVPKLDDDDYVEFFAEPYMIRRRHLNFLNHPKTWTILVEDMHPNPAAE